uniref:NADH dehydrogenase subunit 6 n=2 Tax=Evacanthus TaxID=139554 RepID=A0A6N0A119_9HEMI|nr:NADH dehydrogenase subunit 6 [Evacanthus bivittatus]QKO00208.1 NADH dehydrogenase subunit 6 [Evacanthus acuminatus]QWC53806.1 NADH dehydrogenase subunit 6 [Evacanthus heimianus]WGC90090.1 NADH dehydrogenase subunit 6 [Evacanthus bivittatus]
MKMLMIKMMMINSLLIIWLKNPMSMGLMLLLQTLIMILFMNKILTSSWFVMITFLMMIGGLLIIISYMSSISSNEKFKFNLNLTLILIFLIVYLDEMFENQINEMQDLIFMKSIEQISMIKLYNNKTFLMTILLVNYLLLTMIVISKIVKHYKGPLRSKY